MFSSSTVALIIGISEYAERRSVQGAVNDARAFEEYLLDGGVPPSNIVLLSNEKATREAILTAFKSHLLNNHNIPDDGTATMIFYFAGHGTPVNAQEHLLPPDRMDEAIYPVDAGTTDASGNYVHAIPDYVLVHLLRELAEKKGSNITVILDCCHSGGIEGMAHTAYSSSLSVLPDLDSHLCKGKTEMVQPYRMWSPYRGGSNMNNLVFAGNYPATGRRVLTLTPNMSVDSKIPYTVQRFRVEIASRGKWYRHIATSVRRTVSSLTNANTMHPLALLTTLCAGIATQILGVIRADDVIKDVTGAAAKALKFSAYAAIILNLLATAASVLSAYQLRHITRNEIRTGGNGGNHLIDGRSVFGAGGRLQFLFMFVILCTVLGISFICGEILLYVLLRDGPAMSFVLTGLTVLTMAVLAWTFTCSYLTKRVPTSQVSGRKRDGDVLLPME